MPREIGYPGFRSGRLVMLEKAYIGYNGNVYWKCQCDCGNTTYKMATRVWNGYTKSCGCLQAKRRQEGTRKHGGGGTRLYHVWKSMRERCYTETSAFYRDYGGRGITICDEWQEYEPFRDWALANGYDEKAKHGKCTLDRIDFDGNYEPSNCRFVDMKTQANNTRRNMLITHNGVTKTAAEWADETGLRANLIRYRFRKGLPEEMIFYNGNLRGFHASSPR